MADPVHDTDGSSTPKMAITKRCVLDIIRQVETYAAEQKSRPVLLSVYKFLGTGATSVTPLMRPAIEASRSAVEQMRPAGKTPIGEAVKLAQLELDASGLSRRHILVVTDGENTEGVTPVAVAKAINLLPEDHRSAVYVVAFDVAAATFKDVKDAGWIVLPASNAVELKRTLDILIGEKILLEK